jgi:DNA-binding response OmpR family regulator
LNAHATSISSRKSRREEDLRTAAPHILLVENDVAYAVQLMNHLRDWKLPLADSMCVVDIAPDIERARKYLREDNIDLFIVDLVMHRSNNETDESKNVGQDFAKEVWEASNAGIIVHTSLSEDDGDASRMLKEGVDDYIQKGATTVETIHARIQALWRRIHLVRSNKGVHTNRSFLIGAWKFIVGDRSLTTEDGKTVKLSHTEHAFLSYICTSENNECSKIDFNLKVLGRRSFEENLRVDNFVYRLRQKLGRSLDLLADGGAYRLVDVRELGRN